MYFLHLNRDIVDGEEICVFRENGSEGRDELMLIRQGDIPVHKAWEVIDRYGLVFQTTCTCITYIIRFQNKPLFLCV